MAEGFAPVDVGQVNFDEAQRDSSQCVAQSNTCMRKSAGVDDDEVRSIGARQMNTIDQSTFVVGLEKSKLRAFALGYWSQLSFDIRQRAAAIDSRLARAQQVQIGSVQNENTASHGVSLQARDKRGETFENHRF